MSKGFYYFVLRIITKYYFDFKRNYLRSVRMKHAWGIGLPLFKWDVIVHLTMGSKNFIFLMTCCLTVMIVASKGWAGTTGWQDKITRLAKGGAVLVEDSQGNERFSLNPQKPLVPASILKIVTATAALHELGPAFHFTTDFRLSPAGDLYFIGKGDPLLISEELEDIASKLESKGLTTVRNLVVDDSYFKPGLVLHGTNRSLNPYDAYNGALSANFNTIFIKIGPGKEIRSAEPQTPMTSLARKAALASGLKGTARINLAEKPELCAIYAGELLEAFLEQASVDVKGRVVKATRDPSMIPLYYRHESRWDLKAVLKRMFKYSNNFIANQVFLTLGIEKYGSPATPEKSRQAMEVFLGRLGIKGLHIEEGSGLSRRNRITANQIMEVLELFMPYRGLLTDKGDTWFKTGTLYGVKSIAGYMMHNGGSLRFVIILNGKKVGYRSRERILELIKNNIQ